MSRRGTSAWGADERGITLPEILVALAIIGVALGALAIVIPVSTSGIQEARQLTAATFLAEQMVERARAAAWSDRLEVDCLGVSLGDGAPVPTGATCHGSTASQFPDETPGVAGDPRVRRSVRVSPCTATLCGGVATTDLRRVTVTVFYTPLVHADAAARTATVRLEGLIAKR